MRNRMLSPGFYAGILLSLMTLMCVPSYAADDSGAAPIEAPAMELMIVVELPVEIGDSGQVASMEMLCISTDRFTDIELDHSGAAVESLGKRRPVLDRKDRWEPNREVRNRLPLVKAVESRGPVKAAPRHGLRWRA